MISTTQLRDLCTISRPDGSGGETEVYPNEHCLLRQKGPGAAMIARGEIELDEARWECVLQSGLDLHVGMRVAVEVANNITGTYEVEGVGFERGTNDTLSVLTLREVA